MIQEFPKLMWLPNGLEITVHSLSQQEEMQAQGASLTVERKDATVEVQGVEAVLSGGLDDEVHGSTAESERPQASADHQSTKKKGKK